jgi:hypothetical protein
MSVVSTPSDLHLLDAELQRHSKPVFWLQWYHCGVLFGTFLYGHSLSVVTYCFCVINEGKNILTCADRIHGSSNPQFFINPCSYKQRFFPVAPIVRNVRSAFGERLLYLWVIRLGLNYFLLTQQLNHELGLVGRANLRVIPLEMYRYRNIETIGGSASFPRAVWLMCVYDRYFLTTQRQTSQVENQLQSWMGRK